jgi:hypothetical protein
MVKMKRLGMPDANINEIKRQNLGETLETFLVNSGLTEP